MLSRYLGRSDLTNLLAARCANGLVGVPCRVHSPRFVFRKKEYETAPPTGSRRANKVISILYAMLYALCPLRALGNGQLFLGRTPHYFSICLVSRADPFALCLSISTYQWRQWMENPLSTLASYQLPLLQRQ
jgi:hypothetical protein